MSERIEAGCLDCGLPYEQFPMDTLLPVDQWNAVMGYEPTSEEARREGAPGLLCASCIVKRAAKLPYVVSARLRLELRKKPRAYSFPRGRSENAKLSATLAELAKEKAKNHA